MPPLTPITQALILINVAVFCLQSFIGFDIDKWLALWPIGVNFLPWQILTYGFLHGSFSHLFFNMFGLWMFGCELERLWGPKRFINYYLVSVLAAALAQLLVTYVMGGGYPTVGASGGLFGLLLAFGMMFPNRIIVPLIPPIPMKAKTFVAIYAALELVLGVTQTQSGVAHFAHLGGALGGFLMIRFWRGQMPFGKRR